MCLAIICDTAKPDLDMLLEAEQKNKDGGGMAWIENNAVIIKKGLTAIEINRLIQQVKLPCFVHFRIATIGGKKESLCHPFVVRKDGKNPIEGKAEMVLMHNGHWKDWQDSLRSSVIRGNRILDKGPWSDSRAMAYLVAHHGEGILETIQGEKIAIMNKTGAINYYGYWHEKDGMLFSNASLISVTPVGYQKPAGCYPYPQPAVVPGYSSKKALKREEKLQKMAAQHNISKCPKAVFNCRLCSYKLDRPWKPITSSSPPVALKHDFWECGKNVVDCNECQEELKRNPRLWDELDKPALQLPAPVTSLVEAQREHAEIIGQTEEGSLNKTCY